MSHTEFLLQQAERHLSLSAYICEELQLFRLAVEKQAEKVNNHWHAYIPGFSAFLQSSTNTHARLESLVERLRAYVAVAATELDPATEMVLARDYRLTYGEFNSYENQWTHIKRCHSVTWFRCSIPYKKPDSQGEGSAFVTAVVDNGHEWLRVLSIGENGLARQISEAGFSWGKPDDPENDTELQEILDDEETEIEVLKYTKQLLAAAREIHGGYPHRIRIILPNIRDPANPGTHRFLRGVQRLGDKDDNISLEIEYAPLFAPRVPRIETAIENLLSLGSSPEAPPLSPVLNVDTSVLVALTTDICHNHGNERKWRTKILDDVADEAEHGPRLTKSLYPILRGRTLVCTREAADTCLRMVYDASTDSEISRIELLLGQETPKGRGDDKMAFLERVLAQDGWPTESKDDAGAEKDAATEERRRRLIAELQKLSCHPVPEDLQLPIRIVEDFRREHVADEVRKGTLPKVVLSVEPTLNETNCSSFMFGWKTGHTTITCNRHAVRRLGSLVKKLRWSRDADMQMAPIMALEWARGLAKLPLPGEELVEGPGKASDMDSDSSPPS